MIGVIRLSYRWMAGCIIMLTLAIILNGCATIAGSSSVKPETVSMDDFRKETQTGNGPNKQVQMKGKRGSYFYAYVYEKSNGQTKPELVRIIRAKDTSEEVFARTKNGPAELNFQQQDTSGYRDPMEGSNYIDNPPALPPAR